MNDATHRELWQWLHTLALAVVAREDVAVEPPADEDWMPFAIGLGGDPDVIDDDHPYGGAAHARAGYAARRRCSPWAQRALEAIALATPANPGDGDGDPTDERELRAHWARLMDAAHVTACEPPRTVLDWLGSES